MIEKGTTVLVLTSSGKDRADTVDKIEISCKKYGAKFFAVSTQYAFIDDLNATGTSLTISNYDGKGKTITINPKNTVCFTRGGITKTQIGMAILDIFEKTGMFIINESRPMILCSNKLQTAIELDANRILTPKTAFVSNLNYLDIALDKLGNKFPVIVKTLTGAEGVGVSKIDSYESLKSVLQTLWKYEAEVIVQEYLEIKNDVRVLVLDGKVVAASMRYKAPRDFRTNLAQGAEGGPYELSEEEKQVAEKAAKAFGTFYVGVDMVMSKGKPYVIELNASPGSGNVYRSYFPGSEGKSITGQKLIDNVVKYSLDRNNWHFNHRESGLIEKITIEDVGEFECKMDTGNESYNVLGAENIQEKDKTVTFTVKGKKYTKPIVSHVKIRTNNVSVDRRPVVEFDVEFRNRKFNNVRFSLAPRKVSQYPILIGNKFMQLAKISVNVNMLRALPETAGDNQYIQKICTLNSFVELSEMQDILNEKRNQTPNTSDKFQMSEALEYIETAKYNLKNQNLEKYNKDAIMHADKKFLVFLENNGLLDSENMLDEAKNKQLSLFPTGGKKTGGKKTGGKRKSKYPLSADGRTWEEFKQKVIAFASSDTVKLWPAEVQRLASYVGPPKKVRKTPEGIPLGSGLKNDVVDGNTAGHFWEVYTRTKDPRDPSKTKQPKPFDEIWRIWVGTLTKMARGEQNKEGLISGRGPGKHSWPHKENRARTRQARTFSRRSQGKLFGSQTKEFRGEVPSRTSSKGRVPLPKRGKAYQQQKDRIDARKRRERIQRQVEKLRQKAAQAQGGNP